MFYTHFHTMLSDAIEKIVIDYNALIDTIYVSNDLYNQLKLLPNGDVFSNHFGELKIMVDNSLCPKDQFNIVIKYHLMTSDYLFITLYSYIYLPIHKKYFEINSKKLFDRLTRLGENNV